MRGRSSPAAASQAASSLTDERMQRRRTCRRPQSAQPRIRRPALSGCGAGRPLCLNAPPLQPPGCLACHPSLPCVASCKPVCHEFHPFRLFHGSGGCARELLAGGGALKLVRSACGRLPVSRAWPGFRHLACRAPACAAADLWLSTCARRAFPRLEMGARTAGVIAGGLAAHCPYGREESRRRRCQEQSPGTQLAASVATLSRPAMFNRRARVGWVRPRCIASSAAALDSAARRDSASL